ncbi:MAG: acyltransferase [Bacteroidales bacterium]|nr:acyltransferase [Bacteroidales bacterium]MCF8403173.1 acyltransferase [Bacteroidales bacterium]
MFSHQLQNKLFNISSEQEFNETALQIFRFQFANNPIYKHFVENLDVEIKQIKNFHQIPFLPIEFFKTQIVSCFPESYEEIFYSSGTTGMERSKHFIHKVSVYEESFMRGFRRVYGDPEQYRVLALLPSYLEEGNSSLIYMVEKLIKMSKTSASGFYLNHSDQLIEILADKGIKTILLGVSYALLDLAEKHTFKNPELIVMETGGMKGRRKEIIREEMHDYLMPRFNVPEIHSEYGMTELLSQAYSKGNGIFHPPPWMKILIRDMNDPLSLIDDKKTGGVNVIDLANIYSCSFIATQDLGKKLNDGSFEILGRFDTSDIRGCNLMIG